MVLLAPGLWTQVHTTSSKQLLLKWVDWATSYYSSCRSNNSGAFTEFIFFFFFLFCQVLCVWVTEERRHACLSWCLACHEALGSPRYLSVQKHSGALEWDPNWLIPWCLLSVTLGEAWENKKSRRLHFTIRLSKSFQRIPAKIAYLTSLFHFLNFF